MARSRVASQEVNSFHEFEIFFKKEIILPMRFAKVSASKDEMTK